VPQDAVQLLPRYERQQAPDIFRQGDVFLHPVCNDACPNVVVEALASGLPVVFSQTGGVPELVTSAEGVGVKSLCSWEQFTPPPPEDLGAGIVKIFSDYEQYSQRARLRAETHFGVESYLAKHAEIFSAKARGS
jgi:glycosyltransferase involved in cell wall biosynthesis